MGFYLHKVCVNYIKVQDKFYVVEETDCDLIIGRKAVKNLTLIVVEDVVKIINDITIQVGYIKVNEDPSKIDEIPTSNVSSNNRCWENMTDIDCVNFEVDLTYITKISNEKRYKD